MLTPPDDNFIFSAKVSVAFESDFDAGSLQIRMADGQGAKVCFEYSPQRQPMIVSVVTRGRSDDCNSVDIDGTEVYLRLARTPQTVAFHYSRDGRTWHFVRYFSLGQAGPVQAGFSAQSPRGAKCSVVFSEISYRQGTLKDNRSGE
jgi:regulation of enolase protein 1 (concanavalin A-like superfamily)